MKANRLVLFLAAGASAIALTGCAPTGHVALKVGSTTYSDSDVDLLTDFQCTIATEPSAGVQPESRAIARAQMATVLVASALDQRISDQAGVKPGPTDVSQALDQLTPYIEKAASGKDRDRLRTLIQDSLIGSTALRTIVSQTLSQQLSTLSQDQASQIVAQGVNQLRANEASKTKITSDPVFGLGSDGLSLSTDDTSASKALSSFATSALSATPEQAWLDALPAVQKCG